jgi:predicted transcriptional regulator
MRITVGADIDDDHIALVQAWRRAEQGEEDAERFLAFESWDGLAGVLTGER